MRVLIVEDDPSAQQIAKDILDDMVYEIEFCSRGDDGAEKILQKEWDLILLDIMLPGKNGYDLLGLAKKKHPFTPVIMFTVLKDRHKRVKAYKMGVDDFILKPFDKWEFMARVRSLLKLRETYLKLEETKNVVVSLSQAVEVKDPYTRGHSERVGELSRNISLALGFSNEKAAELYWAGILHDIGKIALPLPLLTKPSKLNSQEYEKVKKHPVVSCRICSNLRTLKEILPAIKFHHERWDGKGYPLGLSGKEIPAEARIMAVADSYDAMTSDRAYRGAMDSEEVVSIMKEGRGGQWQGDIVDVLVSEIAKNGENGKEKEENFVFGRPGKQA